MIDHFLHKPSRVHVSSLLLIHARRPHQKTKRQSEQEEHSAPVVHVTVEGNGVVPVQNREEHAHVAEDGRAQHEGEDANGKRIAQLREGKRPLVDPFVDVDNHAPKRKA